MIFLDHLSLPPALGPVAPMGVAILATVWLARRPRRARASAPAFVQRRLGPPKGVARGLVIGAVCVAALLALGIDLQGRWSTLVAALSLMAIGFVAMWSILSHMLASILIVIFRPFEVGDRVEIVGDDPVGGEVADLTPVYTRLRAEDGGRLQVPNNLFFPKAVKRHAPVLESFVVPDQGSVQQPLGEPQIARRAGVRVPGIARDERRVLVPQTNGMLRPGDRLLGLGTLDQRREFRSWLLSKCPSA